MHIKQSPLRKLTVSLLLLGITGQVLSHGLVETPPSRNWLCGAITKPDEVANGTAEFPECGDAFADDFNGGYQFMSVLTHARGRAEVTPLPDYVCGFGSETFNGGATPWDQAADWPTSPMTSGRHTFTWNIQWGPHFDDTEEFRFWMTKPGFQYERNRPLGWNDFEDQAFCVENYDDANPSANPDVTALKASTQFEVSCSVPVRQGRHIIYAEWGRNEFTLERFHGCVDVVFGGEPPPPTPVDADFTLGVVSFVGDGSLTLDGSGSQSSNLSYRWSVDAADDTLYVIDDPDAAVASLSLIGPAAAQNVTVTLTVANASGTATASDSFLHEPESASAWVDLGPVTPSAVDYAAGDQVSVRSVDDAGVDNFYPTPALTLNVNNAGAGEWPLALAEAVNASAAALAVGVLDGNDQVLPIADPTANRFYAMQGSGIVSAFLIFEPVVVTPPPAGDCTASICAGNNPWWAGLDIAVDAAQFSLDFSASGLDLNTVTVDASNFQVVSSVGQILTLTKPAWVSSSSLGYLGLNGSNNPALASFSAPACVEQ